MLCCALPEAHVQGSCQTLSDARKFASLFCVVGMRVCIRPRHSVGGPQRSSREPHLLSPLKRIFH
jgi:hypothetical protein